MCFWCCDKNIPESTATKFIFKPNGRRFITGISDSYEVKYYEELKPYIEKKKFILTLRRLIEGFNIMWPCDFCFYCGYTCSICTLGLSFCCPNICISDALSSFLNDIDRVNKSLFNELKLNISLQRSCFTSWIEVRVIDGNDTNENNLLEVNVS